MSDMWGGDSSVAGQLPVIVDQNQGRGGKDLLFGGRWLKSEVTLGS